MFQALQEQAQSAGITLRNPPPEPTTCCGRGCNGCVWEGFLEAAEYWRQEALLQLPGG
ncbi:oxidoreductase [Acidovorax sp. Leaf76]|uniref:oxidoreductase-like domain-containing protein n=1 Tax=unclassified Acidovorax TaxID=2684926 RepID=UPI0006F57C51|nr:MULTISPECIES: oxidoreductase-like domain-containing protein [unclassified Acidovorax]KQO15301.1 oxidoreductase [Acidovorax sp. Leaf76]KQO32117.1 oxidoreductase [Acidovorax sp. Leaf84]KQS29613.1 oxidoreductase [Acidovorax sp. Leaf191]